MQMTAATPPTAARQARQRTGFTVAECLVAMGILAMTVLAVLPAISTGQSAMHYAAVAQMAARLAEETMERVLACPYYDSLGVQTPGPESGETGPATFDNMDDWHGYAEVAGGIRDLAGSLLPPEYQFYSRSVTVVYGSQSLPGLGAAMSGLTVTVTVRHKSGPVWTLQRFVPE